MTALAFTLGVLCGWALARRSAAVASATAESRALADRLRELLGRMGP